MRPTESFDEVLDDLARVSPDMGNLLGRIHAARDGVPGARRYDATGGGSGHTSVTFCERCEADRCQCGSETTYPTVSDPTGEAAIRLVKQTDAARRDVSRYHDAIRLARKARETLLQLHAVYMPHDPSVAQATNTEEPEPGCVSCERLPSPSGLPGSKRWEPPETKGPSREDGLLLCYWCRRWKRITGELPPIATLHDHHDGKRISWPDKPKQQENATDRLARLAKVHAEHVASCADCDINEGKLCKIGLRRARSIAQAAPAA